MAQFEAEYYRTQQQQAQNEVYLKTVVLEFKRFCFLAALCLIEDAGKRFNLKPDELSPPPLVDRIWRLLCVRSGSYSRMCNKLFKRKPLMRDSCALVSLSCYEKTKEFYEYYFGRPNAQYWPSYSSAEHLKKGHQGFVKLKASNFSALYDSFLNDIRLGSPSSNLQKRFVKEMAMLKE